MLVEHGLDAGPPPTTTTGNNILAARAKVRLAEGRVDAAVADTTVARSPAHAGRSQRRRRHVILHPALPFLAAGDHGAARVLAEEMVGVAERWGVDGYLGTCLAVLGLVVGGSEGIDHLRASVTRLESSPRRLELGRALVELGAALRRATAERRLASR